MTIRLMYKWLIKEHTGTQSQLLLKFVLKKAPVIIKKYQMRFSFFICKKNKKMKLFENIIMFIPHMCDVT